MIRGVIGALKAQIILIPFLLIALPAIEAGDRFLLAYAVGATIFAGVAAALVDPASGKLRGGDDRASEAILFLGTALGIILGGLDAGRWQLTPALPFALRAGAFATLLLGWSLRAYTIGVNTFFANLLVIQTDRAHQVIDRGPYAIVRHPGYLSLLVILPATALVLGSFVALIPLLIAALRIVVRTAREDRFLKEKLDGYTAYAERVRFRLLPGLW
jgi:protein-S-isoprenylcysteine O-methyltransferase Ste14